MEQALFERIMAQLIPMVGDTAVCIPQPTLTIGHNGRLRYNAPINPSIFRENI